ncbi:hypothetical protein ACHAXT_008123 [Thalassiosira profunda]
MSTAAASSPARRPAPSKQKSEHIGEGQVRRSISVRLIRHGERSTATPVESTKGGTPDFDLDGWLQYVDDRRSADPGLSDIGQIQAQKLAEYLHPHLTNQASRPVRFVISPMRRTIETIVPTLEALVATDSADACDVMINGFYFESEGCHTREKVEPGMNAAQINESLLHPAGVTGASFVGFPKGEGEGWYAHGTGPETRPNRKSARQNFMCGCASTSTSS